MYGRKSSALDIVFLSFRSRFKHPVVHFESQNCLEELGSVEIYVSAGGGQRSPMR